MFAFISQKERKNKHVINLTTNTSPTPLLLHIYPFQVCRIQADDPPWPRVIASILPIISRELMQRYRPLPPPVIMVMSAFYVSARTFVETVEKADSN